MKRKIILIILSLFLCSCSYFQVRNAIKEADSGNYVSSLNELLSILKENNEDRRALDAFEIIYPNAEKKYYDELDISRGRDIIGYTKALLNLLRVQDIYYKLPTTSKNSIAIIIPPQEERLDIKKELTQSFFTIGNGVRTETYEEKLRAHGFFSQAKIYDLQQRKDIDDKYVSSRKLALGKFLINFKGENNSFKTRLKESLNSNLVKYPLFSLGTNKNYNLKFDINISNIKYFPPKVVTHSGIDSYIERVRKTVMERVVETKIVNGKAVEVEKWVPVEREVEVEVFYRYFKHIKTTSMEYQLEYNLAEKNGTPISSDSKKIFYEDSTVWVEYYPLHPFAYGRPFRFPVSEFEKSVMSREEIKEKVLSLGNEELDSVLRKLDSNRIIDW